MCQMCDEADAYRAQLEAGAKGGKAEKPAAKPGEAKKPAEQRVVSR
jgi:hypothetical protein